MERQIIYFNCRGAKPQDCLGAIVIAGKPFDVILMDNVNGKVTTSPNGDKVYVRLYGDMDENRTHVININNPSGTGNNNIGNYKIDARFIYRTVSRAIPSIKIIISEATEINMYKEAL